MLWKLNHSSDFFAAPATVLNFPRETPNKVELKHLLETFQDAMDLKPYGAMLQVKLPYAALQLAANLPICLAIATGEVIEVNGIGMNFTAVNAVGAASVNLTDDQGEHIDPSLDFAVPASTSNCGADVWHI
eukprot:6211069-Pleurochrysis_carterae.AAC.2